VCLVRQSKFHRQWVEKRGYYVSYRSDPKIGSWELNTSGGGQRHPNPKGKTGVVNWGTATWNLPHSRTTKLIMLGNNFLIPLQMALLPSCIVAIGSCTPSTCNGCFLRAGLAATFSAALLLLQSILYSNERAFGNEFATLSWRRQQRLEVQEMYQHNRADVNSLFWLF
jgi:hypothetical protein